MNGGTSVPFGTFVVQRPPRLQTLADTSTSATTLGARQNSSATQAPASASSSLPPQPRSSSAVPSSAPFSLSTAADDPTISTAHIAAVEEDRQQRRQHLKHALMAGSEHSLQQHAGSVDRRIPPQKPPGRVIPRAAGGGKRPTKRLTSNGALVESSGVSPNPSNRPGALPPLFLAPPGKGDEGDQPRAAAADEGLVAPPAADDMLPPTDAQVQDVRRWMNSFSRTASTMMPPAMVITTMARQLDDATRGFPVPHAIRVATSFWMLQQLCHLVPNVDPAVPGHLLTDVHEALFMPPTSPSSTTEYTAAHLETIGFDPRSGLHELLARRPFFEAFRDIDRRAALLQAHVERTTGARASQVRVVRRVAEHWQLPLLRNCFMAWRGGIVRGRREVEAVARFVRRYDLRDVLQTHFFAWRFAAVHAVGERVRRQQADGHDALIQHEAQTHARGVEIEDCNEELRLTVARLKQEKQDFNGERSRIVKEIATHVDRSEHWRAVAVDALELLGRLKGYLLHVSPSASSASLTEAAELAGRVVLGWVASVISEQPAAQKVRLTNFGSDLRDGTAYLLLIHELSPAAVSLDCLGQKDVRKRFEIIYDALVNLGVRPPHPVADMLTGTTDAHFITLFLLWWHFASAPTPASTTCLEYPGSFRDDVEATDEYLTTCKRFYPGWLEDRSALAHYALHLLVSRAKGASAKVITAEEERTAHRDLQSFGIEPGRKVPCVFLDVPFMTAYHRQMNEEERVRINERVLKHIAILKQVYVFYASGPSKAAAVSAQMHDQQGPARGSSKRKETFDRMDFIAFYRFCEDCKIVGVSTGGDPAAARVDGGVGVLSNDVSFLPRLTKQQIYSVFMNTVTAHAKGGSNSHSGAAAVVGASGKSQRGPPSVGASTGRRDSASSAGASQTQRRAGGTPHAQQAQPAPQQSFRGMREAHLYPASFTAAVARIAVLRHAANSLPLTAAPAAASLALEAFVTASVAPFACNSAASAFEQEMRAPPVQSLLNQKRKVLIPFFETFAGLDGNGTMNYVELVQGIDAVGGLREMCVQDEKILRRVFAHLSGASEDDPNMSAARAAALARREARRVAAAEAAALAAAANAEGRDADELPKTPAAAAPTTPRGSSVAAASDPFENSDYDDDDEEDDLVLSQVLRSRNKKLKAKKDAFASDDDDDDADGAPDLSANASLTGGEGILSTGTSPDRSATEATSSAGKDYHGNNNSNNKQRKKSSVAGRTAEGEEEEAAEDEDMLEDEEPPALVYGEFETLLTMLSVFAEPAPFVPLSDKVQQLVNPFAARVAAHQKQKLLQQRRMSRAV